MNCLVELVGDFKRNNRGTIAVIFAFAIVVLFATVALAVDAGRAYSASSKLASAADAAALAAARLLDDEDATDADVKALAQVVFNANINQLKMSDIAISNFNAAVDRGASSVTITSDIKVPTTVAQVVGIDSIDFSPTSKVVFKAKKIELALVLDITGSMNNDGKLAALKTAAKDLVDALFSSAPTKGAVKVSMVPYAGSVNAGATAAADATNNASTDNCVVEREGTAAFTEAAPNSGAYVSATNSTESPKYSCPGPEIVPLTDLHEQGDRDNFKASIDALTASGWTAGHIGTAWGWYTLSPSWNSVFSGDTAKNYDQEKVIKAVIVMTDGMFNTAYKNGGLATDASSSNEDKLAPGSSPHQFLQICNAMRNPSNSNEAIQIYTVAFNAPTTAVELLTECSGPARFLNAENAAELNAAFQQVVTNLTSLRLTQ